MNSSEHDAERQHAITQQFLGDQLPSYMFEQKQEPEPMEDDSHLYPSTQAERDDYESNRQNWFSDLLPF